MMNKSEWDSEQYLKFERERTQPARDLADRVRRLDVKSVLDVGCGPGNSTAVLREVFPNADILGVDNSTAMLDKARKHCPGIRFAFCDANRMNENIDGKFDLIFSNACLQWLPDHPAVLHRLFDMLTPGGTLAVQIPMNGQSPLFRIIAEITAEPRWKLESVGREPNGTLEPENYHDILRSLTSDFALWETTYYHPMPSHQALLEWVKGTRLRPYLNALTETDALSFEAEILARSVKAYPQQSDGSILFCFRRFFFTATAVK